MSREDKKEKSYTLVFCRRAGENGEPGTILLGMKKRGFGVGKWNGFGGKIEGEESFEEAARRELTEECSLVARSMNKLGYLVFHMLEMNLLMRVHVYECWDFEGTPTESEEMRPQWYREDEIPFAEMWPDDEHWFSHLLASRSFIGSFTFEDDETITEASVRVT